MEVPVKEVPEKQTAAQEFGYPVGEASPEKEVVNDSPEASTPQQLISDTIKTLDIDDKGKFIYPDDMDPMLKAAIGATKSFRDTQSSFTKNQQELKGTQAERDALMDQVASYEVPTAGLTAEENTALTELKYTNPDEWYKRMQALEQSTAKRVEEKFADVKLKAQEKTGSEQRIAALEEYNKTTDNKLSQDMLGDTPPSWIEAVRKGELTFEDFLVRANSLYFGNKAVSNPTVDNATNLNHQAGGTKDPQVTEVIDYNNLTF